MRIIIEKAGNSISGLDEALKALADGKYFLDVAKVREKRSLSQNSYWWGVVVPGYAEHAGHVYELMPSTSVKHGLEEAHEDLKSYYLPKTIRKNPLDRRKRITKQTGTSDLDTKQFADLVTSVTHDMPWIPLPGTDRALEFYQEMIRRYPEALRG